MLKIIWKERFKVIGSILLFVPWIIQTLVIDDLQSELDERKEDIRTASSQEEKHILYVSFIRIAELNLDKMPIALIYPDYLAFDADAINETIRAGRVAELETIDVSHAKKFNDIANERRGKIMAAKDCRDTAKLRAIMVDISTEFQLYGDSIKIHAHDRATALDDKIRYRKNLFNLFFALGTFFMTVSYLFDKNRESKKEAAPPICRYPKK